MPLILWCNFMQVPFQVPLEVNVILIGFNGDGGYRYTLDSQKLQEFLQVGFPSHRPSCLETGEPLDIEHHMVFNAIPVSYFCIIAFRESNPLFTLVYFVNILYFHIPLRLYMRCAEIILWLLSHGSLELVSLNIWIRLNCRSFSRIVSACGLNLNALTLFEFWFHVNIFQRNTLEVLNVGIHYYLTFWHCMRGLFPWLW